jgi:hypothetical protein
VTATRADDKLVVHSWQTFTTLQDESGKAIGGINADDVPITETYFKIAPGPLLPLGDGGETSEEGTRCHSEVTMRLEKGAMNYYLPADFASTVEVNAHVGVSSGWLTQFFPEARVESPGFTRDHIGAMNHFFFGSSLDWKDARLHLSGDDAPEAASPEEDEAGLRRATIDVKGQKANGFIYRGVAQDRALLRVVRDASEITITSASSKLPGDSHLDLPELWLTETRSNGATSLRVLHPFNEETAFLVRTPVQFSPDESSPDNLNVLDSHLRGALRRAGLFAEEVEEMITTVHAAHSRRLGTRVFFLVPTKPAGVLSESGIRPRGGKARWNEVETKRVVLGCIELVTTEQRALLRRMAAGGEMQNVTGVPPKPETLTEERWQQLNEIYGWLGQFRNALLLDEQRRRPSPILEAFIARFHLEEYVPLKEDPFRRPRD